jgi:hypothetical protein
MKKLISRLFTASALLSLALGSVAHAGTSDTVSLSGSVTSSLDIAATDTAGATALDLSGGQKIAKVSDLAISTNNEQGFTLTASSGNLTKAGGTSISFQVATVDDGASAPVAGDFSVASGTDNTDFVSSVAGAKDGDLYILYTPATLQDPGTYTGSISLTVSDN